MNEGVPPYVVVNLHVASRTASIYAGVGFLLRAKLARFPFSYTGPNSGMPLKTARYLPFERFRPCWSRAAATRPPSRTNLVLFARDPQSLLGRVMSEMLTVTTWRSLWTVDRAPSGGGVFPALSDTHNGRTSERSDANDLCSVCTTSPLRHAHFLQNYEEYRPDRRDCVA